MWETIQVETEEKPYAIHISPGQVVDLKMTGLEKTLSEKRWVLITDREVNSLYPHVTAGFPCNLLDVITLRPGEASKNLQQVSEVLETLAIKGLRRQDGLIALGGGVVGDIAGFCASIYMRGIDWIQVPTTLLAQVDSSVGGKTGVNLSSGKNLAGSFYQPLSVWIDPRFLETLSEPEFNGGLGEVIKYGLIEGDFLRTWIRDRWEQIRTRDPVIMTELIGQCLRSKARIVAADEKETGLRKVLNVGHTIGHAIERAMDYQITHGEALRQGMLVELELGSLMGVIPHHAAQNWKQFVKLIPVTTQIPELDPRILLRAMAGDKKNRDQQISFLFPKEEGGAVEKRVDPEVLMEMLGSMNPDR